MNNILIVNEQRDRFKRTNYPYLCGCCFSLFGSMLNICGFVMHNSLQCWWYMTLGICEWVTYIAMWSLFGNVCNTSDWCVLSSWTMYYESVNNHAANGEFHMIVFLTSTIVWTLVNIVGGGNEQANRLWKCIGIYTWVVNIILLFRDMWCENVCNNSDQCAMS